MIEIREVTVLSPEELEGAGLLNWEVQTAHHEAVPSYFKEGKLAALKEDIQRRLENGGRVLLALEKEKVVGYAVFSLIQKEETPIKNAYTLVMLEQIAVAATHRREGIGRNLVEKVKSLGKAAGAETLELTVWSFNWAAHDFYRELGLKEKTKTLWERFVP